MDYSLLETNPPLTWEVAAAPCHKEDKSGPSESGPTGNTINMAS